MTEYGTISVRTIECVIAGYFGLVGLLFLLDPASLAAPVYKQWQAMGGVFWGMLAIGIALMHFAALWLNGSAPQISKPVRLTACIFHLGISLTFARMFIDGGAAWGAITYLVLVTPLAILVCVPMARRWAGELHGKY